MTHFAASQAFRLLAPLRASRYRAVTQACRREATAVGQDDFSRQEPAIAVAAPLPTPSVPLPPRVRTEVPSRGGWRVANLARRAEEAGLRAQDAWRDWMRGTVAPLSPILASDSYKVSHHRMYPDMVEMFSYFESRVGAAYDETLFFGLGAILAKFFSGVRITMRDIDRAEALFAKHMHDPTLFNRDMWEHIALRCGGRLPLEIRAVPEGTLVPTNQVLMTIRNTDPACAPLVNYVETVLSQIWYPATVATQSFEARKIIAEHMIETVGSTEGIAFKLHDFGVRGSSSMESAAIGGAAHLLSFQGTDNIPALVFAEDFYQEEMAGLSIPAAEHSTITSWTRAGELDAYRNILEAFPCGPVAVVSDSYDIYTACEHMWGETLRDQVLQRDGVLVVRPDSGEPHAVVLRLHEILGKAFGTALTERGYKKLMDKIAIIQGDGINEESLRKILQTLKDHGWSSASIAFGSGGALLQKGFNKKKGLDRDTQKNAFKCSAIKRRDGTWVDVYKSPVEAQNKVSKKGQMKLIQEAGVYKTVPLDAPGEDVMVTVFRNGEVVHPQSFADIRGRVDAAFSRFVARRL